MRQPRQLREQLWGPHVGVFRRRETVEEPCVDARIEQRQLLEYITDQQGQGHPAAVETELLKARMHCHVLVQQRLPVSRQLRPQLNGAAQVGKAQRVLFDADEMQAGAARGLLGKQLPGAVEVHPGAKPGLADHQAAIGWQLGKALAQAVAFDEHVLGFEAAFSGGEVHVVVLPRVRAALIVPVNLGVLGEGRVWHGRLGGSGSGILSHCAGLRLHASA
ncbi:hypothetical protein PS623_04636 [Pseudomonas fluorescens]|nr:hypothetical protein PS623_04636 [Pseudomonas fluorescens]